MWVAEKYLPYKTSYLIRNFESMLKTVCGFWVTSQLCLVYGYTHTHTNIYIYIYIYVCVCVCARACVCVCVSPISIKKIFQWLRFFFKCYFSNIALQKYQTVRKIGWKRFMSLTVGVLY